MLNKLKPLLYPIFPSTVKTAARNLTLTCTLKRTRKRRAFNRLLVLLPLISGSCLSTVLLVSSLEPHRSGAPLPDLITFMDVMDFFLCPSLTDSEIAERNCLYLFSVVFQLYGIMLWYVTFHQPFKTHPSDRLALRWTGLLSRTRVASRGCDKYLMTSNKICESSHLCSIIGCERWFAGTLLITDNYWMKKVHLWSLKSYLFLYKNNYEYKYTLSVIITKCHRWTCAWSHRENIYMITSRNTPHQRIGTATKYGVTSKHIMKTSLPPFSRNYDMDIIRHSTNRHNVEIAFHINEHSGYLALVQTGKKYSILACLLLWSLDMIQKALTVLTDVEQESNPSKEAIGTLCNSW